MSEQSQQQSAQRAKSRMLPFIGFLLLIVLVGAGIAFGILWFTTKPVSGSDTAAFLPPDTKIALHVRGVNEVTDSLEETVGPSMGQTFVFGNLLGRAPADDIKSYCAKQVHGDCRLLISFDRLPDEGDAIHPMVMVEGRHHEALLSLFGLGNDEVKVEDLGDGLSQLQAGEDTFYFALRGPFVAASDSRERVEAMIAAKETPYVPTGSQASVEKWASELISVMADMSASRSMLEMAVPLMVEKSGKPDEDQKVVKEFADYIIPAVNAGYLFGAADANGLKVQAMVDLSPSSAVAGDIAKIDSKASQSLLASLPAGHAIYIEQGSGFFQLPAFAKFQSDFSMHRLGMAPQQLSYVDDIVETASAMDMQMGQGPVGVSICRMKDAAAAQSALQVVVDEVSAKDQSGDLPYTVELDPEVHDVSGVMMRKMNVTLTLSEEVEGALSTIKPLLLGDGRMEQWVGVDGANLIQIMGNPTELMATTLRSLHNEGGGLGSQPAYQEARALFGKPLLMSGFIDVESMLAPVMMFLAPGLLTPGDEPRYVSVGVSAPKDVISAEFFVPKYYFEKMASVKDSLAPQEGMNP